VKRKEILSLVAIALVIVLLSVFGYIGFPLGTYDLVPAVRTLDLSYNLDGGNYVIYELVARDTSKAPETEETEENDTILKPGVLTDENYTETEEEVGEILGITDEDVISTVMVMQYRLYNFGITPYTISLEGNGRIRGEFANNADFDQIVELLGTKGVYEFKDPNGKVLFDSQSIDSANAAYYTDDNGEVKALVNFDLNDEATRIFADSTAMNAGGQYTITLDGEIVSQPFVDRQMKTGTVSVTGFKDLYEAQRYALLQVSGQMPLELNVVSSGNIDSHVPASAVTGGVIGILLALVVLVLFEKAFGLITAVSALAFGAIELLLLVAYHYIITLEGIMGIFAALIVFVAMNLLQKQAVAEELKAGRPMKNAWRAASKTAMYRILQLAVPVLVISALLYLYGNSTFCGFGFTLGLGLVAGLVTFFAISRTIMMILANSRKFQDKPCLFGVKKEGKAA